MSKPKNNQQKGTKKFWKKYYEITLNLRNRKTDHIRFIKQCNFTI